MSMRASVKPAVERLNKWAGPFMIVLALALGASYAVNLNQNQKQIECQSRYNVAFAQQLIIRARLTQQADEAQTLLISEVGKLTLSPPTKEIKELERRALRYQQLFRDFDVSLAKVEAERAANPLPPIPDC